MQAWPLCETSGEAGGLRFTGSAPYLCEMFPEMARYELRAAAAGVQGTETTAQMVSGPMVEAGTSGGG